MIETEEDKGKFEQLYKTYKNLMFYVSNRILNDEFLAEDTVHQTFIKIIEKLDKIEDVHCHKTKSYIVIMVRNCSINFYNRRKNQASISLEEIENVLFDEDTVSLDGATDLTKAILKLPEIYQSVLTLKYVQGFSNAEIAGVLDITEETVRKRLERARNKTAEIMEKENQTNVL